MTQEFDHLGAPLTRRQLDTLRVMTKGLQAKEAGQELGVTESCVKQHLSSAYRRLGVESLVEAFMVLGWLQAEAESRHVHTWVSTCSSCGLADWRPAENEPSFRTAA